MHTAQHSAATVIIAGPTGVGKTQVGVEVARRLGGEVLSADSRQIYRGLDIGTAKPTAADQARARHHFIDIADPHEPYSAGRFGREARDLASILNARGVTPVVVGGSGLYLSAFMDGLFPEEGGHQEVRSQLRSRLEQGGLATLYEELGRLDPVTRSRLDPADRHRILRALERALLDGQRASRRLLDGDRRPLPCMPLTVCLHRPRDELHRRIDDRVEEMVAAGWAQEVAVLLESGCERTACGLESLGYQEMARLVTGGLSGQEVIAAIQQRSRRYAKRQLTWFRRDRRMRWIDLSRVGVHGAVERIEADWARRARTGGVSCSH